MTEPQKKQAKEAVTFIHTIMTIIGVPSLLVFQGVTHNEIQTDHDQVVRLIEKIERVQKETSELKENQKDFDTRLNKLKTYVLVNVKPQNSWQQTQNDF